MGSPPSLKTTRMRSRMIPARQSSCARTTCACATRRRLPRPTDHRDALLQHAQAEAPGDVGAARTRPFEALCLVCDDFPGQWFEADLSSDEEARAGSRGPHSSSPTSLLCSWPARNCRPRGGGEDLKSMLRGLREGLEKLKDYILVDKRPLAEFPDPLQFPQPRPLASRVVRSLPRAPRALTPPSPASQARRLPLRYAHDGLAARGCGTVIPDSVPHVFPTTR
jgi:hypothetical protein